MLGRNRQTDRPATQQDAVMDPVVDSDDKGQARTAKSCHSVHARKAASAPGAGRKVAGWQEERFWAHCILTALSPCMHKVKQL